MSPTLYKKVLITITDKVIPFMTSPLLLSDFLTQSFDIGLYYFHPISVDPIVFIYPHIKTTGSTWYACSFLITCMCKS